MLAAIESYASTVPGDHHLALAPHPTAPLHISGMSSVTHLPVSISSSLKAVLALRRIVGRLEPDVVHAHSSRAGLLVRLGLNRIWRARAVYTPHCYAFERCDVPEWQRRAFWLVELVVARLRPVAIGAVSQREAALARAMTSQPVVHVPNIAGDLPDGSRTGEATGAMRFVAVARVCPQKGPDFFIRAMEAFAAQSPCEAHWVWVGGGEPEDEEPLRRAGVEVTGWVNRSEAIEWLRSADVYLHTAQWEGAPITVLEAAALEVPIVARRIDALDELGLTPLVDTPEEMAGTLAEACDETRRQRLRAGADIVRQRFTASAQREALMALYRSVAPGRSPRVLIVINDVGTGGAARQAVRLAEALRSEGRDVRILSLLRNRGHQDRLADAGVRVDYASHGWPRSIRAAALALRTMRAWRPDVAVSFLYQANIVTRVTGRLAGVPLVVSSIRSEQFRARHRALVLRLTDRLAHVTTVNSEDVRQRLIERGVVRRSTSVVVPNGLDIDEFDRDDERPMIRRDLAIDDDDFVWITVGRLKPEKDHATLLGAFERVLEREPSSRLLIAGAGHLRDDLEALAARLGIGSRVTFLGHRSDVPALLAASDGVVLASLFEGLPNAIIEAMAAARPVVVTDVGGVRELVDASTGRIVPPRHADLLAAAMLEVMRLPAPERRLLGKAARERARERYEGAAVAQRWRDVLESAR